MTMLHAVSFDDGGDIGFPIETDSGTICIGVNLDAEELACRAKVSDLVLL